MNKFYLSSTGEGVKLRIKAFIPLIVPIINSVGDAYGITIVSEDFEIIVDSIFVLLAVTMHIVGWVRALKNK